MHIPLDYYRILGVPMQATDDQLQQAYGDRSAQLPRREYGDFAIEARQQLLDQAYHILANTENRAVYDAHFLEKTSLFLGENLIASEEAQISGIDILDERFVGGLLILQELGEYELVIRLGENYLNQISETEKNPAPEKDIIFTVALADLELSREQWGQQNYEAAATLAKQGLKWLTPENLFPQLQEEIQAEYDKLRPYRILNFLSKIAEPTENRSKGLQLLQEMLQERQGIDGLGLDGSGLTPHQFLLYIQQLRPYLTVDEQLAVFETASRPSSAVDACLNVYILIAKGFAARQPDCILKATSLLERLSKHQDVYLEQAICALLLGQTEPANLIVEKSQETNVLDYIREQSLDSPDLLPGLYEYAEKWLQSEVYPQFQDLVDQQVSLQDYFADESVQNYLEQVSNLTEIEVPSSEDNNLTDVTRLTVHPEVEDDSLNPITEELAMSKSALSHSQYLNDPNFPPRYRGKKRAVASSSTPISTRSNGRTNKEERSVEYTQNNLALSPTDRPREPKPSSSPRKKPSSGEKVELLVPNKPSLKKRTRPKRKKFPLAKPLFMGLCLLGAIGLTSLAVKVFQDSQSPLSALQGEQLNISLHQPPLDFSLADAQVVLTGALTHESSKQVIQAWLSSKSQAFGSEHNIKQLDYILAEPLLSDWRKRAIALKAQNSHWQYQHQLQIQSMTTNPQNPDLATVEAKVQETAKLNQNGKIVASRSYDQNLSVRYELVRQKGQWLIKDIKVLK